MYKFYYSGSFLSFWGFILFLLDEFVKIVCEFSVEAAETYLWAYLSLWSLKEVDVRRHEQAGWASGIQVYWGISIAAVVVCIRRNIGSACTLEQAIVHIGIVFVAIYLHFVLLVRLKLFFDIPETHRRWDYRRLLHNYFFVVWFHNNREVTHASCLYLFLLDLLLVLLILFLLFHHLLLGFHLLFLPTFILLVYLLLIWHFRLIFTRLETFIVLLFFAYSFVDLFDFLIASDLVSSQIIKDHPDEVILFDSLVAECFFFFMREWFVSVFYHMLIFFAIKGYRYFWPFLASVQDFFQQDDILSWLPVPLCLGWVQVVQPSLSALLGISEKCFLAGHKKLFGNIAPL